jgi:hypothetical protein
MDFNACKKMSDISAKVTVDALKKGAAARARMAAGEDVGADDMGWPLITELDVDGTRISKAFSNEIKALVGISENIAKGTVAADTGTEEEGGADDADNEVDSDDAVSDDSESDDSYQSIHERITTLLDGSSDDDDDWDKDDLDGDGGGVLSDDSDEDADADAEDGESGAVLSDDPISSLSDDSDEDAEDGKGGGTSSDDSDW